MNGLPSLGVLDSLTLNTSASTTQGQNDRLNKLGETSVKLAVWRRDGGKCVVCGASDDLHFDHDLPYSKGGTSITEDNVQLMCARHNLEKGAKII
jgi:5-methylcytosine-specific restriction endonuclease McrA